jgi:tetratricopeptide (TPR) repeat protein
MRVEASSPTCRALAALTGPAPPPPLREAWEFTRGFSLFRLGRIDAAEAGFRRLLKSELMQAPANFFVGNCLYARGRYAESLPYYEKAIAEGDRPDNKALNAYFYNRGLALYQLRLFEPAAESLRRSIGRYSQDPLPWLFLGRCETELGQFAGAIESFESAIRLQPDLRLAYYHLARLHAQHGDKVRAEQLFQKVAGIRQQELEQEEQTARRLKLSSK